MGRDVQYGILGPLEASVDGVALDVGGRKQRAVLAVLLINLNRVVSLDRLIDELWGDDPPARATGTLQAYISNLRRVLEPDRAPRTPPQVLATQPPGYVLRAEPGDVDAIRFQTMTEQAAELLEVGDPAAARDVLDEALALWRGPALADFAGEPFARAEAARLENLRELAYELRATAALALGAHATVVGELDRLVAEHPLRERLWELRMLALYRSGRQAEALRAFSQARQVLKEELGVTPGPALQALEGDILAQSPTLDWEPPAGTTAPAAVAAAAAAPEPIPAVAAPPIVIDLRTAADHLVGRDEPLGRLDTALADAFAGRTRLVVVAGAAGIGKTSVIDAFTETARAHGAVVARGRAVDERGAPALWPWTQVLRDITSTLPPDDATAVLGDAAVELAPLLPEAAPPATAPGAAPAEVDPRFARFRLYDAVAGFLRRAAAAQPLVVVLDDVQWADVTSIRLLEFVAGELRDAPLLILIACRDEAAPEPALTECLATVARQPLSERITLRGLDDASVRRYIEILAGSAAAERIAHEVHRRTGGNPFFVTELVRLLRSENRLDEEGAAAALPAGVRDVIRQRIARMPDDTQSLLVLAAVVGQSFTLDTLLGVSQLDDDRLFELIEPALVTGILVESAEIGRYEFAHALVRDTLYASLTTVRRARLHMTVAKVLEQSADRDGRATVADLARHWHAAGDRPQGMVASLRAAEQAFEVAAFDDALAHFERALSVWDAVPDAEVAAGRTAVDVFVRAAYAACYAGRDRRAVELAAAGLARVDTLGDPRTAARALASLGRAAWIGGDTATAARAYNDAVALLAPLPPSVEQAEVLATDAQALMLRSRYAEAVDRCRDAIAVARLVGARAAEGHARNSLGSSLSALGRVEEGLVELDEARRIAVELDRPDDLCRALVNRSTRLISCGQVAEGVAAAMAALDTARRSGLGRVYGTFVAANAGFALTRMGRWDEADALISDALAEPAPGMSAVEVRLARAELELRRGNLDEARSWLDDVEQRIAGSDSASMWAQLLIFRAELALLERDLEAARDFVDRGLSLIAATDDLASGPELVALGVRAAAEDGDAVEADRLLGVLRAMLDRAASRGRVVLPAAEAYIVLAEAEAARAHGEDGDERFEAAARRFDEIGFADLARLARTRMHTAALD